MTGLLGRGPFDRAGSLVDPQPGEHYRIVLGAGNVGIARFSRADTYDRVDQLKDLAEGKWLPRWAGSEAPIGVVRVIPQTTSLAERMKARLEVVDQ